MKLSEVRQRNYSGFATLEGVVTQIDERRSRNDHVFHIITIQDKSGSLPILVFAQEVQDFLPETMSRAVAVDCEIGEYKGNLSVKARSISLTDKPVNEFVRAAAIANDIPGAVKFFAEIAESMVSPDMRRLFEYFTTESWVRRFSIAAAAKEVHHAYRGGFLEHITDLLRAYHTWHKAGIYPHLNSDVVYLGLLLHDIGKIKELEEANPGSFNYTDMGLMQGHLVIGYRMCYEVAKELGIEKNPLVDQILHIILAHHGTKEFGSPVLPATGEALIVHLLDNIDAKLHMIKNTGHRERNMWLGNARIMHFEKPELSEPTAPPEDEDTGEDDCADDYEEV